MSETYKLCASMGWEMFPVDLQLEGKIHRLSDLVQSKCLMSDRPKVDPNESPFVPATLDWHGLGVAFRQRWL